MQTYAKLAYDTVKQKVADGTIVFDEEFVFMKTETSSQKIPAADFWAMVLVNMLPELDADHWGMLACGPLAFILSFALYVTAMTEVAVGSLDLVKAVLRMTSSGSVVITKDGKAQVKLEAHPHDGERIGGWQGAIADLMKYPKEAAYARTFAADESGGLTRVSWTIKLPQPDDQGDDSDNLIDTKTPSTKKSAAKKTSKTTSKSKTEAPTKAKTPAKKKTPKNPSGKPEADEAKTKAKPQAPSPSAPQKPKVATISASAADFRKCLTAYAQTLSETKTDCLNGESKEELVNLTPEMHQKVDDVRAKLRAGDGMLSDDYHTFFLTVGSAFCEELFEQVNAGGDVEKVLMALMDPAMQMLNTLADLWEADVKRLDIYKLNASDVQPKSLKAKSKKS
jgi:hypothetical protein